MIRAITFDKQLMKSEDFAHITRYFYQGKMGVTKGCEISQDADGNIVVSDGYFSIYGRYLKVEGEEVIEVPQIPSGVLYSILVFEIDLSKENTIDEFAQGHFKIISDVSGYPTPIQEDLENGGTIYQLEFCRFENTVAGAVNLVDTRTILSLEMYTLQEDFMSHLADNTKHWLGGLPVLGMLKTADQSITVNPAQVTFNIIDAASNPKEKMQRNGNHIRINEGGSYIAFASVQFNSLTTDQYLLFRIRNYTRSYNLNEFRTFATGTGYQIYHALALGALEAGDDIGIEVMSGTSEYIIQPTYTRLVLVKIA